VSEREREIEREREGDREGAYRQLLQLSERFPPASVQHFLPLRSQPDDDEEEEKDREREER